MNELNEDYLVSDSTNLNSDDFNFWTNYFNEKAENSNIFCSTLKSLNFQTKDSAIVIGNKWLQFSNLMPKILCLLASKVDSNQARMRILKIAWEELGQGQVNQIHPETFKRCLELSDVKLNQTQSFANAYLEKYAEGKFRSNSEVFGLGLGLEIIAIQNIDTVFKGLAFDSIISSNLKETEFFKIHFENEEGHIRHCIESFIKYCPDKISKCDFLFGFENGLRFWKLFWGEVSDELKELSLEGISWAN